MWINMIEGTDKACIAAFHEPSFLPPGDWADALFGLACA
jgi:hypothetical protein